VDPKGSDFGKYRGATLLKPNLHEAGLFLRRELEGDVHEAGRKMLEALEVGCVLLTRGSEGMSLFRAGVEPLHVPAHAREVFDVTGAGDTVAATLALALASGAALEEAAQLASRAAAVTVGRVGTSPRHTRRTPGRTCPGGGISQGRHRPNPGRRAIVRSRYSPERALGRCRAGAWPGKISDWEKNSEKILARDWRLW
jgi:D-beta-D-heptose 7-phosphate kinase/D-beta-D-heptose 1-phosphate adenosyltransferase